MEGRNKKKELTDLADTMSDFNEGDIVKRTANMIYEFVAYLKNNGLLAEQFYVKNNNKNNNSRTKYICTGVLSLEKISLQMKKANRSVPGFPDPLRGGCLCSNQRPDN